MPVPGLPMMPPELARALVVTSGGALTPLVHQVRYSRLTQKTPSGPQTSQESQLPQLPQEENGENDEPAIPSCEAGTISAIVSPDVGMESTCSTTVVCGCEETGGMTPFCLIVLGDWAVTRPAPSTSAANE